MLETGMNSIHASLILYVGQFEDNAYSIPPMEGKPAIALKYTFGKGNTGMQRELYCAAWFAFAALLAHGETLPELARLPEEQMAATMRRALSH